MAWRCSAITNERLVAALERENLIKTPAIIDAMREIDRKWFVPLSQGSYAYEDRPLSIGHGATISAPHMHAIMLELIYPFILDFQRNIAASTTNYSIGSSSSSSSSSSSTTSENTKNKKVNNDSAANINRIKKLEVLDIGSGSGYLTAVLANLCERTLTFPETASEQKWHVCGIEHIKDLHKSSLEAMKAHCLEWIKSGVVSMVCGDGRNPAKTLNLESDSAQFNIIHVGAAVPESMQANLEKLLKPNGCLVIPVGEENETQQLLVCHRDNTGQIHREVNCHVVFVPLTTVEHQVHDRGTWC